MPVESFTQEQLNGVVKSEHIREGHPTCYFIDKEGWYYDSQLKRMALHEIEDLLDYDITAMEWCRTKRQEARLVTEEAEPEKEIEASTPTKKQKRSGKKKGKAVGASQETEQAQETIDALMSEGKKRDNKRD